MSHRYTPRNRTITLPLTLSQTDYEVLQGAGAQNDADIALALVGMIDEGFNRLAKPEPLWEGEPDPEPLPDDPFADEEEESEPGNVMGYIRSFDTRLLIAELRRRGKDNFEHWANGPLFPSNPDEEEEEESPGGPWIVLRGDSGDNLTIAAAHFTDKRDADRELTALAGQGIPAKLLTYFKNGLYT